MDGVTTRNLFFTGKGGVGKTSLACATAVYLTAMGLRTLIVSTDPASNLDEVLGTPLSGSPTEIVSVPGLFGMNIDPEAAASRYRERAIGHYRGVLPEATIRNMEEGLSGACTTEIAAFDEFTTLLGDDVIGQTFDRIVFDTAPTGHTLRLLSLPSAWTGFIDSSTTGMSCLGPLTALDKQATLYRDSVSALKDAEKTTLFLVARPDGPTLKEAGRASMDLAALGVSNQRLIVNGLFTPADRTDLVAVAMADGSEHALSHIPASLEALPRSKVPLAPMNMVGIEAIRVLLGDVPTVCASSELPGIKGIDLTALVEGLATQKRGVIMTLGKGGVGKTTVAAAIARELALRGHSVLLTTTDPAAHVSDAVGELLPTLTVGRIDPHEEVRKYTAEVIRSAGEDLVDDELELLKEDLRSPCTEEIAVFRAFAEAVSLGETQFVVLDTAPTGHTVLLLDAAEAYHREVLRTISNVPDTVRELLPRLRDPAFTKLLIVTLPESTPVHEAASLQSDLRRAGIEPYAWIVNQSLALAGATDPLLRVKACLESGPLSEVELLSDRVIVLPWIQDPSSLVANVPARA